MTHDERQRKKTTKKSAKSIPTTKTVPAAKKSTASQETFSY